MVHCILNLDGNSLKPDPTALNKLFNGPAEQLVRNNPSNNDIIVSYINSMKIVLTFSNYKL